jgi:hypothetical protein
MLDWFTNLFKPKKTEKQFLGEVTTVITDERIDLDHKGTGKSYSFWIGHTTDNQWFAITDETQSPRFCLDAEDRDEAYTRGVAALNSYFKYLDTKNV